MMFLTKSISKTMKKQFITVADLALKMDNLPDEQKSFMNNIAQLMCDVINKSREGELSPEDVEDKFKSINDQLKNYDAEKFDQLIKDNQDLCSQVKQLGETVKKLKEKGLSMEVINKFDEKVQTMLNSPKFNDFVSGITTRSGAFEGFSLKEVSMASNYSGDNLITQQTDRVVSEVANKKLHMRNVVAVLQGDPEYTQLAFAQVYEFDRNAAYVSENGSLPESSFKLKEVTASTKRVGTHIKISKRMLKSRVYLRSFILNMLPEAVLMAEDFQMLFGDGNGDNLQGIINTEGVGSVEGFISTAISTGAAGCIDDVLSYNDGADCVVVLKNSDDKIIDGMTITFANAVVNTSLNGTFPVKKLTDKKLLISGAAYTGTETGKASMTYTVKHGGFKSVDLPNSGDAIKTAFAVMSYAQFTPNIIVLNPITVNSIASEKDSLGRNLDLIENRNGVNYIAGRPIIESTNIPAGDYLLGDFVNGANLVDYTSLSLEWADDVTTKLKNQVVLIAQEEVIFPIYMPWAFAYGNIASLITAITKS